ncbi:MAG: hypothetical protein V4592_04610 [Bacteroidota bacterium]
MKYLSILLLILLTLSACMKQDVNPTGPIIEPPFEKLISRDTLKTGQQWGITIGQSNADIYAKIQEIQADKHIDYVGVVGNVFTSLAGFDTKIPLYQSIFLDQSSGTSTGIQISFADDKVKAIFTNDGTALNKWPLNTAANATIAINDPVGGIYQKLVNIKQINAYANKFERLSIFSKYVSKVYDPGMSASPLWYFVAPLGAKRYNVVDLNFSNGKLVSIYSSVFESQ